MREINTQIQIAASPEKVWQVLTDFAHWKGWNPTANAITGDLAVGSKLTITMRNKDGGDGHKYTPVITVLEKPKWMRWQAKMISNVIFSNDKSFELREVAGGTLLFHREIFSGLIVPLFWSKMSPAILPMLESMNAALKKKVEDS